MATAEPVWPSLVGQGFNIFYACRVSCHFLDALRVVSSDLNQESKDL